MLQSYRPYDKQTTCFDYLCIEFIYHDITAA